MDCGNCGQPREIVSVTLVAAERERTSEYAGAGTFRDTTVYRNVQPFIVSICEGCVKQKERTIRLTASIILPAVEIIALIAVFVSMGTANLQLVIFASLTVLCAFFLIPWFIYSMIMLYRKKHQDSKEKFVIKRFKKAVAESLKKQLGRERCFIMGLSDWLEISKRIKPVREAGSAAAIDKEQ
jgi:ABC-type multidrug transport system fused ATPase/permease subunit